MLGCPATDLMSQCTNLHYTCLLLVGHTALTVTISQCVPVFAITYLFEHEVGVLHCLHCGAFYLQVSGYAGLLLAVPTVLYEIAAYVVPGLTKSERRFLAPVIFGSSVLFYVG